MAIQKHELSTPGDPVQIPSLGFGVWQVPDDEAEVAVAEALRAGYRHIDTAKLYENEAGVGRALSASGTPREDVFVTTKLWPTEFAHDDAIASFEGSMSRLRLDVLDLFLLHWPAPGRDRYVEAYRAMMELREAGRVRAIGVSNFPIEHLERLHEQVGEWPAINQIELHPYLQQRELRDFHGDRGIATEAWSPLASGKRVLDDPVIAGIASARGCTPAQAIIAWHLAIGNVVIPKSVTPARIAENLAAADVVLQQEDLDAIAGLDQDYRTGPDPAGFEG